MAIALREARPVRGVEFVAERPDGTRIDFAPFPTPIFDEQGQLAGAVNLLVDITEQKKTQKQLAVMAHETDHRANNLMASMQAVLHLTKGETVRAYKEAVLGRLAAVARANQLLSEQRWSNVDLLTLFKEEFAAFDDTMIRIEGPPVAVRPDAAQSLSLLIHELCTNSVKYGALSSDHGEVRVSWTEEAGSFKLVWAEEGAPRVVEPTRKGVGTTVIAAAVSQLNGKIVREWRASGLTCTLICSTINVAA